MSACRWCKYGCPKASDGRHVVQIVRIGLPPVWTYADCKAQGKEDGDG